MDTSKLDSFRVENHKDGDTVMFAGVSPKFIQGDTSVYWMEVKDTRIFHGNLIGMVDGLLFTTPTSDDRLFTAPKKRTVWVNLYILDAIHGEYMPLPEDCCGTNGKVHYYNTEAEANRHGRPERIGNRAHPIEIEK